MSVMKFKREKVANLMGETEVRFTEEAKDNEHDTPYPPLMLTATKRGVVLSGNSTWIMDQEDLQSFAKALSEAWKDHRKLQPQIHVTGEMPD